MEVDEEQEEDPKRGATEKRTGEVEGRWARKSRFEADRNRDVKSACSKNDVSKKSPCKCAGRAEGGKKGEYKQ